MPYASDNRMTLVIDVLDLKTVMSAQTLVIAFMACAVVMRGFLDTCVRFHV